MNTLTSRERLEKIIYACDLFNDMEYPSNISIAKMLGISRERVRQLMIELGEHINRRDGWTWVKWPCPSCGTAIRRQSNRMGDSSRKCRPCLMKKAWDDRPATANRRRTREHRYCSECNQYIGFYTDSMMKQRQSPVRCRSCSMKRAWRIPETRANLLAASVSRREKNNA